jgi:3-oxoacyl-[acyl-carrier-protein] synthase II
MPAGERRVVVTGMGVVAPGARDLSTFWRRLEGGVSSVGAIRRFDASRYPTRIAAEIDGFREEEAGDGIGDDGVGRIEAYASAAVDAAVADSGLEGSRANRSRIGVLLAAGMGSYGHREIFLPSAAARAGGGAFDWREFFEAARRAIRPGAAERRTPGSIASRLAARHGLTGPVMAVMTACAAGTQALGDAARWIRRGKADAVVAGGADSELYPMGLASFCLLGALSTRCDDPAAASRPFDRGRDGFVIGEGAGALVLEEREHAVRRGARIRAEIAGFGSACDSYRVTDPHPDGRGAVAAMRGALRDAGVHAGRVGYINAHGTSTVANDRAETRAIRSVFGGRAGSVPVSSTKSMIGHLTVAAGAVEAIATVLTLERQKVHPTINLTSPDPECDLDYVPNRARPADLEYALSNSFAFGGQCASLLLRRASS